MENIINVKIVDRKWPKALVYLSAYIISCLSLFTPLTVIEDIFGKRDQLNYSNEVSVLVPG